jgi:uncharacterized protein with HEPN domain
MSRDDATLLHIVAAAKRALAFLGGASFDSFLQDEKTQSAVLHQLLILGEAVKRLSDQVREQNPDVPWKKVAGLRDVLIHEYDTVDVEEVWRTVTTDIPKIIPKLERLVPPSP